MATPGPDVVDPMEIHERCGQAIKDGTSDQLALLELIRERAQLHSELYRARLMLLGLAASSAKTEQVEKQIDEAVGTVSRLIPKIEDLNAAIKRLIDGGGESFSTRTECSFHD